MIKKAVERIISQMKATGTTPDDLPELDDDVGWIELQEVLDLSDSELQVLYDYVEDTGDAVWHYGCWRFTAGAIIV